MNLEIKNNFFLLAKDHKIPDNLESIFPETIKAENAVWHTITHFAKVYRYGDFAVKCLMPKPYIMGDTAFDRLKLLIMDLKIARIYNQGDPNNISTGIIIRKNEEGKTEPFLVMKWIPGELRLDEKVKNNAIKTDDIENIVRAIKKAHQSIKIRGNEKQYYSKDATIKLFVTDIAITYKSLDVLKQKDLLADCKYIEKLYVELANELGDDVFEKRLADGYVKFSHSDTKSDNIYIRDGKCIFLDPAVENPMWYCVDVIDELAALATSIIEDSDVNLANAALNSYMDSNKENSITTKKLFWLFASKRIFLRGWVNIEHSMLENVCEKEKTFQLNMAKSRIDLALKFVKNGLILNPEFSFFSS